MNAVLKPEIFDRGIQALLLLWPADFQSEAGVLKRNLYFMTLNVIPEKMFVDGIKRCIAQWKPYYGVDFPLPAEIGEFCVPGESHRQEMDDRTLRWKRVAWPWNVRLDEILMAQAIKAQKATRVLLTDGEKAVRDERRRRDGKRGIAILRDLITEFENRNRSIMPVDTDEGDPGPARNLGPEDAMRLEMRREMLKQQARVLRGNKNGSNG